MPKGGARKGAGRPKGQGKYGEATKAIRVPESKVKYISEIVSKGLTKFLYTETELQQDSRPLQMIT